MKTYLTKNGLLVVREDAAFFTANDGTFRRLASKDEVTHLLEIGLPYFNRVIANCTADLNYKLSNIEVPLWHYLWTISSSDYSSYKPGTCNNGGDYAFHEHTHFYARCIDGNWEIKKLVLHSTSAEFSYDELNGEFQNNNMGNLNFLGIADDCPLKSIYTQTMDGCEEDIIIDRLLEASSYDEALEAVDSSTDTEFILTEDGRLNRLEVFKEMGISIPKRHSSGRNRRRV